SNPAPLVQQGASGTSSHVDNTNAILMQDLMAQMAIMTKTLNTLLEYRQQGRSVTTSVDGVCVSPSIKSPPDVADIVGGADGPRLHIGDCGNNTGLNGTVSSSATCARSPTLPLCNVGSEEIH